VGIKNTGADRADPIEEDVEDKKAKQEDRKIESLLRLVRGELLRSRPVRREFHKRSGEDDS
jgi:hypothetical protein